MLFGQAEIGVDPAIAFYTRLGVREDVLHYNIAVAVSDNDTQHFKSSGQSNITGIKIKIMPLPYLAADQRVVGVAAAGSWAENSLDKFSDLDLSIAVEPESLEQDMSERQSVATSLEA